MKNKTHGLSEREMEVAKLLMADCKTTGDIQAKLKRLSLLFAAGNLIGQFLVNIFSNTNT